MKQGLSFTRALALPANVGKIRVLVYDRASDAVGSLTLALPNSEPKP